jgi:hypothetical protein
MEDLERLNVLHRLLPPEDQLLIEPGSTAVKTLYSENPDYGGHKLIFVNVNETISQLNFPLNSHPAKESVFLMTPLRPMKPLIWIFARMKHDGIEQKVATRTLYSDDFIAVQIPFNNPEMSFFTVNEYVPHLEITIPGNDFSPSFWVAEPEHLPISYVDLQDYELTLQE